MSDNKRNMIEKRIEELIERMEKLEEINAKLIEEGKEDEFNPKYGIEYENISDEIYRQRIKLKELNGSGE